MALVMASQLSGRVAASLPQWMGRRSSDDSEKDWTPWNYTSVNGHVCEMPRPMLNTETAPLIGDMDFYTINTMVTGACACIVLLSLFVLMFRHATHFSRPNEQLNIMRICCYLPIFSIGCYLQVLNPNSYVYLYPLLDLAQAVALCNFFLLMCEFVSPSDSQRELFFLALELPQKKKKKSSSSRRGSEEDDQQKGRVNGLHWHRRMYASIFQYPVVQFLISIFTAITENRGVYCLVSSDPYFAHLWLDVAHMVSLTIAVMACVRLLSGLRGRLSHHRPIFKLLAFKLLIAVMGLIQIVYWILRTITPSPLKPTAALSFADDFIGIPVLILALLTVPFSIFFHFAYDVQTYYLENVDRNVPLTQRDPETATIDSDKSYTPINGMSSAGSSYQGGPLGIWAWLGMLNPSEFIAGLRFGFIMMRRENREKSFGTAQGPQTGGCDEND